MTPLEKIQSMKMPFAELKGVTFTEAGMDRVVAKMLVRPDLCTLRTHDSRRRDHGLCGHPWGSGHDPQPARRRGGHDGVESKTKLISGAPLGTRVIGEATPVHRGRRTQVWQTRVMTPEGGKLIALVTQTQMVL